MKVPHVHCYGEFPGEIVWCWEGPTAPVLGPDDIVEVKGETFQALPTFVGMTLDVKRDWRGAQVATRVRPEPSGLELIEREPIGAGATA